MQGSARGFVDSATLETGESALGRSMISQDTLVSDLLHELSTQPKAEERKVAPAAKRHGSRTQSRSHSRAPSMEAFLENIQASSLEDLRDAVNVAHNMENLIDATKNARSLELAGRSLGDNGVKTLVAAFLEGCKHGNLGHLDLSNNGITHRGFAALAEALESGYLPALSTLIVSQNNLGDNGVDMLSRVLRNGKHSSLEVLDLSNCGIGESGMVSFADSLQSGNFSAMQIQTLNFSGNLFGEHGAVALTRAMVMGRLAALRVLNISHNVLGQEGTLALAEVISAGYVPQLSHLYFSRCYIGEEMVPISRAIEQGSLPALQALDVSGNYVGETGGAMLASAMRSGRMSRIQVLNLSQCALTWREVDLIINAIEVGQIRDLLTLDLSINTLDSAENDEDDSTAPHVYPPGDRIPMLPDRGSYAIARLMSRGNLSKLQHLNLSQCSIDDRGFLALAERMAYGNVPMLQRFFFEGNDVTSKKSIKAIVRALESGHLASLEQMELGRNRVGEDVNMALASALMFSSATGPVVEVLKDRLRNLDPADDDVIAHLRKFWTNKSFRGLEVIKVDDTAELNPAAKTFNKYLERQYSQHLPPIVNEEAAPINNSTFFFNLLLLCGWLVAVFITKLL